jgi:hypothetical protein
MQRLGLLTDVINKRFKEKLITMMLWIEPNAVEPTLLVGF